MPELHVRDDLFFLTFPLGEEVGPFDSADDAREFLDYLENLQGRPQCTNHPPNTANDVTQAPKESQH